LLDIIAAKAKGQPLSEKRPSALKMVEMAHGAGLRDVIVVDVTAEAGMEPVIDRALDLGYSVVMANKKALAGPWATAQHYFNHPRIRHESTVGGGQPVIATLRYLLDTSDPIYQIEGQLSGTLGFICQQLDQAIPFSQAVAEARARGFTEPDPREDLGGKDVMRKVMILGRMAGWPLTVGQIAVESLFPETMAGLTVPEFMTAVSQLDVAMAQRVQSARAAGNVLRYMAIVKAGQGTVGLQAIPASSGLSNLKYISFQTGRYHDEALLIGGKGAGVEMTAAGVHGDMIALLREGNG
jgi:homoserine dehydrogenase